MKLRMTLIVAVLLTLVLAGCRGSISGRSNVGEQTIIDWVDFLKLNGISYNGYWNAAVTDPSKIGGVIGKVRFRVSGNVHDPSYVTKNGDAAFLEKGTVVYAIEGYPDRAVVAVKDAQSYNGYRLYIDEKKKKDLEMSLERATENTILKATIEREGNEKVAEFNEGSAAFFISLLQRGEEREDYTPNNTNGDPVTYRFVLDSGAAIGYTNQLYYDGIRYYWHSRSLSLLPNEMAYYLSGEREVVFRIRGMEFTLPRSAVTVATGERIRYDGSMNNIALVSPDGKTERWLFPEGAYEQLMQRILKENPGSGESKTILYWASRPIPVGDGRSIAFESNKETVLDKKTYFHVHLIDLDGTNDRVLVDGSKYGNAILLDSVGDSLIAEGQDHSLLHINVKTGQIDKHPINGNLDALSKDGRYVLYRNMVHDAQVGSELWAFDLKTGEKIALGDVPDDYIYNKGVK